MCESDFWSSPLSSDPSNDIIAKCFLANFLTMEQLYLRQIVEVSASDQL